MPRGAWLAAGATGAALAASLVGPGARVALVTAAMVGLIATILALRHRVREAAVALGITSVCLRLVVVGLAAPAVTLPPDGPMDGPWNAEVITLGSTADGQQRATLLVQAATPEVRATPLGPWRVYAWLPRYPAVIPMDRIAFHETVEPTRQDSSEFAGYLAGIHVVATVRIGSFRVSGAPMDPFGIAERLRSTADTALARVLPEPMAGLASGILVGRRDRVSREVSDSFTTTGLSHVVAISGWNICLVGAVIGGLLSAMGMSRRSRTVAIVVALGCFTLLAGGGASVVRAALMGGVALIARESGRPGSAAAALGIAVWLLLLLDPWMVSDVGFQLSVAATAGLLAWGSRLTRRLTGDTPGRPRRWLAESLGVSLAAQAATLPLVLFHFGRLSLVSPLANLVIAPLVAPAMLVGAVALLAGLAVGAGLPFVVGAPFALLGWLVLGAMVGVSNVLAAVPYASLELGPAAAMLLAAGTALVVGCVAWRARGGAGTPERAPAGARGGTPPTQRPAAGQTPGRPATGRPAAWRAHPTLVAASVCVLIVLTSLGMMVADRSGPGRLTVTVLDVGQGDAILVEGPRGGRILVDSGPDPDRLLLVLDRHVPAWDRRLDLVVLTHPHEDHVAGLAMLLGRYRVAAIAENGMIGSGPGDAAYRAWLAMTHTVPSRLAAGDRLSLDGVAIDVRWPIRGEVPARSPSVGRAVNDTSVVLDLRYGERRMVLTSDIEDDVDPRLLASGIGGAGGRRLDVLKVAHHGSRTATSEAWLNALQPLVAMVSTGTGNPYGHPAPETIERLRVHGARVLRTDLDGDLQVGTDGHDLRVATSGGRPVAAVPGIGGRQGRDHGTAPFVRSVAPPPAASQTSILAVRFLCPIPLATARLAAVSTPVARHPPMGRPVLPSPRAHGGPGHDAPAVGTCAGACYDRVDHGAFPRGRGRPLPVALTVDAAATTRLGGRGRRIIPRRRRGSRGPPGEPADRGSGGPAPRSGQGARPR